MSRYVALLRGINVGGKHSIRMTDLKACFEAQGLDDVATYIQSGNVVFTARGGKGVLYFSRLVARVTESQLARVVKLPIYKSMTIRNWRTTTTLAQMVDGEAG